MNKTNLTKEQMIKDVTEMDPIVGEWVKYLFEERYMTVKEALLTMQRMVEYIQKK